MAKTKIQTLWVVLLEIVGIWVISDIGYYSIVAFLVFGTDYSSHPFVMAWYYLFWSGIALATFWPFYKTWKMFDVRARMFVTTIVTSIAAAAYLFYILPLFPPIHWANFWEPPSELLTASRWYFLPKSIEILLQQLLVIAMVLAFDARKFSLKAISYWSAFLFGGIHLLLVFGGSSLAYVAVFTLSATAAGFIFPYFILRVENGFIYSYFLHWGFYALVIVLARILLIG